MAHRAAPRAEADLDDIWLYVARESGSIEIANRLIDTITDRFYALAQFPYLGRSREEDFGPGYRSLAVGESGGVLCDFFLTVRLLPRRTQSMEKRCGRRSDRGGARRARDVARAVNLYPGGDVDLGRE